MVGLNMLMAAIGSVAGYLSTHCAAMAGYGLRTRAFRALNHVPIPYIEGHHSGLFVERVSQDADALAGTLVGVFPSLAGLVVSLAASIVLMGRISPAITALVLLCVPGYYLINGVLAFRQRQWQVKARLKAEELTSLTVETIAGLSTARIYGAGSWLRRRYAGLLRENLAITFGSWRTQLIYGRLSWGLSYGWGVLLTCGAWYLVFSNRITLGESIALGMYIPILLKPVEEALGLYRAMVSASVAAERLGEIMVAGRVPALPRTAIRDSGDGPIGLEGLTFAYGDNPPCLRDISLRIDRGQRILVLGPTGSGKTTLLKVLAGTYGGYRGRILLGGCPLPDPPPAEYLSSVGMVMAENFFFSASVLANLRIADPRMTEGQIRGVARQLGLDAWLAGLPDGYHTHLGVGGIRLSSGQAQKLALLRAMLKRPPILLLDELTSAMDVETERNILDGLRSLCPDDGILVMTTHRLNITLEPWIDRVIVLDAGRIVEEGQPSALYASGGHYQRLMDFAGLQPL